MKIGPAKNEKMKGEETKKEAEKSKRKLRVELDEYKKMGLPPTPLDLSIRLTDANLT